MYGGMGWRKDHNYRPDRTHFEIITCLAINQTIFKAAHALLAVVLGGSLTGWSLCCFLALR